MVFLDFKSIVMRRYAVKKFNGKKVDESTISKLVELIQFSASSFNLQPWKIKVVTDQKIKDEICKVSWNQPQVNTCSHLLVLCADSNVSALIDQLEALLLANGANADSLKDYLGMMRGFASGMNDDQKKIWAQKQCYIALSNAMNGATSLGLDSCPMEGFDPAAVDKILHLPKNLHSTLLVPIGYPEDMPRPKLRFPTKTILI